MSGQELLEVCVNPTNGIRGSHLCTHDVLLGRGVAGVQQELIGDVVDPHPQVCSGPHVYELYFVVGLADDDVLGLHISVYYAGPVRLLQSL